MNTLFAILPCYNEQENIIRLITRWFSLEDRLIDLGYSLRIIAIDDKSQDDTLKFLEQLKGQRPEIIVVCHEQNQGLGGALLSGLRVFASEADRKDLAIVMDADNSHDPVYAFDMIAQIQKGSDCVIASRFCPKSIVMGVPIYRQFLSLGAKYFYQMVLTIPGALDYTCGFRAYQFELIQRALAEYNGNLISERSFACMMELLFKLHKIHAKISEIPFVLRYDLKLGKSKMKITRTILKSVKMVIKLRMSSEIQ